MKQFAGFVLVIAVALFGQLSDSWADKGGQGNGKGKWKHGDSREHGKHRNDRRDDIGLRVDSGDRVIIRQYIANTYYSNCPPGLAKKHNGCLPPGQAKKRYIIGQPLPDYVVWEPVPPVLMGRLRPVPAGYQYVTVDKDVLLISEASHHVIDAVTLLSAVGN